MRPQGKRIFDAPTEDKEKCTIQKNNRGWSGMNYETLDPKNQRVRMCPSTPLRRHDREQGNMHG